MFVLHDLGFLFLGKVQWVSKVAWLCILGGKEPDMIVHCVLMLQCTCRCMFLYNKGHVIIHVRQIVYMYIHMLEEKQPGS